MSIVPEPRCIWILEDDRALRSTISCLACEEGLSVVEFATLSQAIEALRTSKTAPRAILSDFHLPDGDAEEFLRMCQFRFEDVPIYCISGDVSSSIAQRLKEAKIEVYSKPITLGNLLKILEDI